MALNQIQKETKEASAMQPGMHIVVDNETKNEFRALMEKINKKQYGKRIRASSVISRLIKSITPKFIQELQDASLSNNDKFEMAYKEYVLNKGPISKDDFMGMLLAGEVSLDKKSKRPQSPARATKQPISVLEKT